MSLFGLADTAPAAAESSIERHFSEHYESLYRFLRTCGAPESLAEDFAQEAFLRLHHHLAQGRPSQNVRAWLCRVAYRLWVDRLRHDSFESPAPGDFEELRDPALDPEQELLAGERDRWLRAAMSRLSELQRQCLHLRADGLKYREISEVLGIGYWRVVEAVRQALEALGGEAHGR